MVEKKNETRKLKYKVVSASDYYAEAKESYPDTSIRKTALCILFEKYEGKIKTQVTDSKSGELLFVVEA